MLTNPKWEAFAVAYAEHGNGTRAAIDAGYSEGSNKNSAAQRGVWLLKKQEVKARIDQIREGIRRKALASSSISRTWILEKMKENAEIALERGDRAAANRALELLGREYGLFTEKKVILAGPLEALDARQLQRLLALAQAAEDGRLALPKPAAMNSDSSSVPIDKQGEILDLEATIVPDEAEPVPDDDDDVLG